MTTHKRHGFFRRTLDAYIAARQRQADIYISRTLLSMDDATLKAHGYERRDLEKTARL